MPNVLVRALNGGIGWVNGYLNGGAGCTSGRETD
jgi:hypothetical protein